GSTMSRSGRRCARLTVHERSAGAIVVRGTDCASAWARPSRLRSAAPEARPAGPRPSRLRFAALEARPALARPSRLRFAAPEARPAWLGCLVYGLAVRWARHVDRGRIDGPDRDPQCRSAVRGLSGAIAMGRRPTGSASAMGV